jgi:hypothetical protein
MKESSLRNSLTGKPKRNYNHNKFLLGERIKRLENQLKKASEKDSKIIIEVLNNLKSQYNSL